ncbi:replicative DNA helicase [Paenibacillus naphthalenovorans]|uniref:replicative DNA helicase n=1 Tax=Paenibacillus naphthalenovorans TaxID=162209 RepID=UPI000890A34D|nr:DnaB-like helicase C-terminal domain-containing protein [Paenibacillus naphthalenovorans]SDJ76955.1 Replicative DNA helicase [Paenibacillus naphthalenovorans]
MLRDYETEVNALAGLLLSDKILHEGLAVMTTAHYDDPDNAVIFDSIRLMSEKGRPTFTIVYKELRNQLPNEKLLALKNAAVTESSFKHWLDKLHDLYIRRSYWKAARDIAEICQSERTLSEITDIIESRILHVNVQEGAKEIITPEEAGRKAAEEFERRFKSNEKTHGIKLSRETTRNGETSIDGFPGIDRIMKGLKGGDLLIVAAETGEGKTTLAQNIVRHASIHQDYRTYYQNTEMDPDEIVFRFVAQMSNRDFEHIYTGAKELTAEDRTMIRQAFESYTQSHVYISELPVLTPEKSRGLARQFKTRYGKLDLLVIDYVGRMELENSKGKQEWQIMRDIAKECKKLAQELDAACILIAQLTEEGKLQGARAMANEADGMFFLIPLDEEETASAPFRATHKLVSKKARRGDKKKPIWLSFNKPRMYITEVLP